MNTITVSTAYNTIIRNERHVVIARDQDSRAEAAPFAARVPDKSEIVCIAYKKYSHSSLEFFR